MNLAALEELEHRDASARSFLDAQATDLTQAVETLENAIRRIDRETRELLQETFETVNAQLPRDVPGALRRRRGEARS